jgi:hypothetical protein
MNGTSKYDPCKISIENQFYVHAIKFCYRYIKPEITFDDYLFNLNYELFKKLKKNSTTTELLELTNFPNEVVRVYSFIAIKERDSTLCFPLMIEHLNDDEYVFTHIGCIVAPEKVGDIYVEAVIGTLDFDSKTIDSTQLRLIDSILIFTPNNLKAKSRAINRVNPTIKMMQEK